MLSLRKVLVVNDHGQTYFGPFEHLGMECTRNHEAIEDPKAIALVVFTGGHDVSPELYDKTPHPRTSNSVSRDLVEVAICETARRNGIPMVGICRGAQFLCVMAGGSLVQDITGHLGSHKILARYPNGELKRITVTSSHHQMQYPFNLEEHDDYEVLAFSPNPLSRHYAFDKETTLSQDEATQQLRLEPDVIWYPRLKALGAQFHPEWMQENSPGFQYFRTMVERYLVPVIKDNELERKKAA